MKHEMKLHNEPFNSIKNKTKTIEMRLNDEKRQKIKVQDIIIFTNTKTFEQLVCEVVNIYKYQDFNELYKNHNKIAIGYQKEEAANPIDMEKYYNPNDIKTYGVVGIEIKIVE